MERVTKSNLSLTNVTYGRSEKVKFFCYFFLKRKLFSVERFATQRTLRKIKKKKRKRECLSS